MYVRTCTHVCMYVRRYPDFAPMFHAEFFNPDEWADLFKKAGAKCACFYVHYVHKTLLWKVHNYMYMYIT